MSLCSSRRSRELRYAIDAELKGLGLVRYGTEFMPEGRVLLRHLKQQQYRTAEPGSELQGRAVNSCQQKCSFSQSYRPGRSPYAAVKQEPADIAEFRLRMEQLQEQFSGWLTGTGVTPELSDVLLSDLLVEGRVLRCRVFRCVMKTG